MKELKINKNFKKVKPLVLHSTLFNSNQIQNLPLLLQEENIVFKISPKLLLGC